MMRRLKFFLSLGGIAASLAGCVTPPTHLTIDSAPSGATVLFEDGRECITPCNIKATYKAEVTVAKAGYKAKQLLLPSGAVGVYVVNLDLIAGTTEVETTSLPEL